MSIARIAAIYRKDIRDALRDSRLLMALLMPLLLGVLYSFMFQDDARPTATLGVVAAAPSELPAAIVAATDQALALSVDTIADEATLNAQIADKEIDVGFVIPAGFDADLTAGRSPTLKVVLPASPSYGGDYVAAIVDRVTEAMAGRQPSVSIERVAVPQKSGSTEAAVASLGVRRVFVLVALILMLSMIAAYALPATITEETEKRTLQALTLVASHAEVIVAKALFGLTYCVFAVPLMLVVTRSAPSDPVAFVAAFVVSAVVLVGLGLLLGGAFKTQAQLNTWSGLVILPLLAPSITIGLSTPPVVNAVLFVLPTSQTMRLGINAFAGEAIFARTWLSYVILLAWAALAYGLVWWRLRRQEAA